MCVYTRQHTGNVSETNAEEYLNNINVSTAQSE